MTQDFNSWWNNILEAQRDGASVRDLVRGVTVTQVFVDEFAWFPGAWSRARLTSPRTIATFETRDYEELTIEVVEEKEDPSPRHPNPKAGPRTCWRIFREGKRLGQPYYVKTAALFQAKGLHERLVAQQREAVTKHQLYGRF